MSKIYRLDDGVVVEHRGTTYNFPLNAIMVLSEDLSSMVNIKMKSYKRTLISIPNEEIEGHKETANDTARYLNNILYGI